MNHCTAEQLIAFENRVKEHWEAGDIPYLTHLCGGNEQQLIDIFDRIQPGDWIFASHRCHYHALLAGWDPEDLLKKILAGKSMFLYSKKLNFVSSAIVGGNCGIAAGVALSLLRQSKESMAWCFVGDGCEDGGHLYEAVRFVEGFNLPCQFIIEDNDLSVETTKRQRRGPYSEPPFWPKCVEGYTYKPTYPHAGSGCKHRIEFKMPA